MAKRIAHFIDTFVFGGAERVLIDLTAALGDYGFETAIFHFGHPEITAECDRKGLSHFIVPGHNLYKSTKTLPLFALKFRSFIKKHKVSLLHSHLFGPIVAGSMAAFLARIPHVGTLHDVYIVEEKPARIKLLQLAALLGTKLITVSKQMEKFYTLSGFFPRNTFQTIYNGVDTSQYNPLQSPIVRKQLGLQSTDFLIAAVGRLVKLKGFDLLIAALSELKNPRVKLIIIGDGPESEPLKELSDKLNVRDQTLFLGFREDIPALLTAANLFVLPSYSEGLSRSLLEAMASGLTCVATNVGGNPELIEDRQSGFTIAPGDIQSLSECLTYITTNPQTLKTIGETAKNRIEQNFSFETMLKSYLNTYGNLLP